MLIEVTADLIDRLTKTELGIIQYINDHRQDFSALSIVDIAFNTYTSPATVSRAIKKCGLSGFNELRMRNLPTRKKPAAYEANQIILQAVEEARIAAECISIEKLIQISLLIQQSTKVYVLGRGLSEYVAEELSMKLQLLGKDSMFIRDPNIMRLITKTTGQQHLVINISLNGHTPELITAAQNARHNGAEIITLCCNPDSPLIPLSTVALIGYSNPNSAISRYEVRSRLPLQIMSRILTEHLASHTILK